MGSLKVLLLILFASLCTTVIGIQSMCQGTHFCMCLVCLSVLGLSVYQRINRYPFQCLEVMKKILYGADSVLFQLSKNSTRYIPIFTVRKLSLRRLCFHRCLSVYRRGVSAPLHAGIHPPAWADTLQADTPRANTPRQTPPGQIPPLGRHPPLGRPLPLVGIWSTSGWYASYWECNLAVKYRFRISFVKNTLQLSWKRSTQREICRTLVHWN